MFPAPRIRVQGLHANASILSAEEVTPVRLSASSCFNPSSLKRPRCHTEQPIPM